MARPVHIKNDETSLEAMDKLMETAFIASSYERLARWPHDRHGTIPTHDTYPLLQVTKPHPFRRITI